MKAVAFPSLSRLLLITTSFLVFARMDAFAFEEPRFLLEFGQIQAPGPFVFSFNSGVGVDSATGDVYVTDNVKLQRFDRHGNFIAMWSCAGCFGLDVNTNTGEVYVAAAKSNMISRYTPAGTLLASYGGPGTGPGQFNYPHDVAVDSATGNLYVVDNVNGRVQQLDADGAFIREWGAGLFSGEKAPAGIAFDPASRVVYVSDPHADRIQKFDEFGNFLLAWTTTEVPCGCQSADQMRWVRNITVGADGNLYVADADGERISVWSPEGAFLETFSGPHSADAGPFHPRAIAVNQVTGETYVCAAYASRVDKFDASHAYLASWGGRERDGPTFDFPRGIAVSPVNGDVYVVDAGNYRIKRFSWLGGFLGQWGEALQLIKGAAPAEGLIGLGANTIVVDPAGDVWSFNNWNHYQGDPVPYFMQRFAPDGVFHSGWAIDDFRGSDNISGAAIETSTGRVFLSYAKKKYLKIFDSSGVLLETLTSVEAPAGLAIHGGFFYVLDSGTDSIKKFEIDGSGVPLLEWGGPGSGPGQFALDSYSKIVTDDFGRLYVADTYNHRIQIFDGDGNFVGAFGSRGTAPGQFRAPMSLAVSSVAKLLYVMDTAGRRVQAFQVDLLMACGDGVDNDGDGRVDFPEDPACWDAFAGSESVRRWHRGCGLGFEIAFLLGPLLWLRRRREASAEI